MADCFGTHSRTEPNLTMQWSLISPLWRDADATNARRNFLSLTDEIKELQKAQAGHNYKKPR